MPATFSVITPSYNQAAFIERTIRSVLAQDVANLDYMVVDGGSTDGTRQILARYSPRISWVSDPDGGQAEAVNRGITETKGAIIGWLNSDDIYYPQALQRVGAYFEQHPGVEILYGDADHIDSDDRFLEAYPTEDWNYQRLVETCFLCQPAVFFRRSLVDRFGLLDARWHYALDYEYWLRIGRHVPFERIPYLLAGSRVHPGTKTFGSPVQAHREYLLMFKDKFGRVPDRWVFNYAHAQIDQKRIDRGKPGGQVRYILWLLMLSPLHFLRWNRRIPASALRTMREWISQPLAASLQEIWPR